MQDDELILYCLNFINAAALHVATHSSSSCIGAALTNPSLTTSLVNVAAESKNLFTQCNVIITVHAVVSAVAVPANPEAANAIINLLQSIAGKEFYLKPNPHLAIAVYGLACLGALAPISEIIGNAGDLLECASKVAGSINFQGLAIMDSDANTIAPSMIKMGHVVLWPALEGAMSLVISALLQSERGINAVDSAGYTLLHKFAEMRDARCLSLLLKLAGNKVDLLVRTRAGANALQLARQANNVECEALLFDVTQKAADALQEALLKELEESPSGGGDTQARKSRKKKSVTRSASFAADQPDEKFQKLNGQDDADKEANETEAAERRMHDEKLQRQVCCDFYFIILCVQHCKAIFKNEKLIIMNVYPYNAATTGGGVRACLGTPPSSNC